jgi:hypothetical protein
MQERFNLSKRIEVFATPFAILIDTRGVIAARAIVSTKQYLGFVLSRAAHDEKQGDGAAETFPGSQASPADAGQSSRSYSTELDHVCEDRTIRRNRGDPRWPFPTRLPGPSGKESSRCGGYRRWVASLPGQGTSLFGLLLLLPGRFGSTPQLSLRQQI